MSFSSQLTLKDITIIIDADIFQIYFYLLSDVLKKSGYSFVDAVHARLCMGVDSFSYAPMQQTNLCPLTECPKGNMQTHSKAACMVKLQY